MALHLEDDGLAVADVDHAGVLAGALDHLRALGGQRLQPHAARLVGAVLAPHHREDAELGQRRLAAEDAEQPLVLVGLEPVLGDDLGRDGGLGFGIHPEGLGGRNRLALGRAYSRRADDCRAVARGCGREICRACRKHRCPRSAPLEGIGGKEQGVRSPQLTLSTSDGLGTPILAASGPGSRAPPVWRPAEPGEPDCAPGSRRLKAAPAGAHASEATRHAARRHGDNAGRINVSLSPRLTSGRASRAIPAIDAPSAWTTAQLPSTQPQRAEEAIDVEGFDAGPLFGLHPQGAVDLR